MHAVPAPDHPPDTCYFTVVGDELSFRPLTPGDRSDHGALPRVRPCPHPVAGALESDADGVEPAPVCAGHRALALDARRAQRDRLLRLPQRLAPLAAPPSGPLVGWDPSVG